MHSINQKKHASTRPRAKTNRKFYEAKKYASRSLGHRPTENQFFRSSGRQKREKMKMGMGGCGNGGMGPPRNPLAEGGSILWYLGIAKYLGRHHWHSVMAPELPGLPGAARAATGKPDSLNELAEPPSRNWAESWFFTSQKGSRDNSQARPGCWMGGMKYCVQCRLTGPSFGQAWSGKSFLRFPVSLDPRDTWGSSPD